MECIYTTGSNCASVTYGNVAQHIKEYIRARFPKDFFNYEHISSEIAYRNIRRQLGPNTRNQLAKRSKPYLIIRPVYTVPDEMYLFNTPMTSSFDHIETSIDRRYLLPIIQDTHEGIGVSYTLNRDRIEFQVTVTVSTQYQQLDLYKMLANIIHWERSFTKRCTMEFMIPRGIVMAMAARKHINLNDENYSAGVFLDYLNNYSAYPITYKMRTGTSKDEYFMYSNQEMLITFTDLQINEGVRKNMADESFDITFNVITEFNLPGMFFLIGSPKLKESTMTSIVQVEMVSGGITFPLFTLENLFGQSEDLNGFRKFRSSILQIERNSDGNDVTEFAGLINNEIKGVIRMYNQTHIDISTLASIHLYKNSIKLTEGVDYKVDWTKLSITTFDPSTEDSYRFILYLNMIKINEMLVNMTNAAASDKPALKPKS